MLHLVRHGLDNHQIARARHTSVEAVEFHLRNITSKVDARGRTALRPWDGIPALLRSAVKETTMTTDGLDIQNLRQVHVGIKDVDPVRRDRTRRTGSQTLVHFRFTRVLRPRRRPALPEHAREWRVAALVCAVPASPTSTLPTGRSMARASLSSPRRT